MKNIENIEKCIEYIDKLRKGYIISDEFNSMVDEAKEELRRLKNGEE